jgi:predicted transcriptional regulator
MKNKTFIFKYDPESSMERLFADLQQGWQGKLKLVEPHIIKSNSIKALLHGLTEERLELFSVLVQKKPANLERLTDYLNRDYQAVKKDAEILAA